MSGFQRFLEAHFFCLKSCTITIQLYTTQEYACIHNSIQDVGEENASPNPLPPVCPLQLLQT